MTNPLRRIFTATLVQGVSGSGKTSLLGTFARYLWETYQNVLLLYSWDGGAIPTDIQKLMKQGLIRFWRVRTRSAPGLALESLYMATRGYWPRKINPETGETAPAVELVAPVVTRYTLGCPKGHGLGVVTAASLIQPTYCSDCKDLIALDAIQTDEDMRRTKGLELVGGVAFDGLTSMTTVVLDHMDHARGHGQIGGEKAAFGGVVVSGSIMLGGNTRADIGFGQSRAQQFVANSLSIPFLKEGPIFTALSFEASDEGGLTIVGPKLPGRAATDEAASWFGNVAESAKITDDNGKKHFILYLRPFVDPQGRRHLLKTSASPDGLPDFLIDPPEDARKPFESFNLGLVFKMLDDDLKNALADTGAALLTPAVDSLGDPYAGDSPAPQATTAAVPPPAQQVLGVAPPPSAIPVGRSRKRAAAAVAPPGATTAASPAPTNPATVTAGSVPPPPGARPPQRAPGA